MTELIFLGIGAIRPGEPGDHTSLLLRHGDANVLIDPGPSVAMQLARVDVELTEITHMYFSHQHGDHMLGSPMLLFYQRPLTILAAPQVLDAWQKLVELVYPGLLDVIEDEVNLHLLPSSQPHMWPGLPGVCCRMELVHHAQLPAYALRMDFLPAPDGDLQQEFSLVYSGDTAPTESVKVLAKDADLLIHEATYLDAAKEDGDGIHSSAGQAGAVAEAAGARKLALVHRLAGDHEAWVDRAAKTFSGSILLPQAGGRLTLPEDIA